MSFKHNAKLFSVSKSKSSSLTLSPDLCSKEKESFAPKQKLCSSQMIPYYRNAKGKLSNLVGFKQWLAYLHDSKSMMQINKSNLLHCLSGNKPSSLSFLCNSIYNLKNKYFISQSTIFNVFNCLSFCLSCSFSFLTRTTKNTYPKLIVLVITALLNSLI